jgi:hypothetical protein
MIWMKKRLNLVNVNRIPSAYFEYCYLELAMLEDELSMDRDASYLSRLPASGTSDPYASSSKAKAYPNAVLSH